MVIRSLNTVVYGSQQLHIFLLWCQYKNEKKFAIYLVIRSRWSLNKITEQSSNKMNNKEAWLKMVEQLPSLDAHSTLSKIHF